MRRFNALLHKVKNEYVMLAICPKIYLFFFSFKYHSFLVVWEKNKFIHIWVLGSWFNGKDRRQEATLNWGQAELTLNVRCGMQVLLQDEPVFWPCLEAVIIGVAAQTWGDEGCCGESGKSELRKSGEVYWRRRWRCDGEDHWRRWTEQLQLVGWWSKLRLKPPKMKREVEVVMKQFYQ